MARSCKGCRIEGCEDENIIELANGCICCTVADDFLPTIEALLNRAVAARPYRHRDLGPGAAEAACCKAFAWPEVRTRVTVDGVIAVVDGPAVAAGRFAEDPEALAAQRAADPSLDHDSPLAELFEDQLACADIVILNKIRSDATRRRARPRSRRSPTQLRPSVKIVPASFGAIDARIAARRRGRGRGRSRQRGPAITTPKASTTTTISRASMSSCRSWRSTQTLCSSGSPRRSRATTSCGSRDSSPWPARRCAWCCRASAAGCSITTTAPGAPGESAASRLVVIGLKGLDRARDHGRAGAAR